MTEKVKINGVVFKALQWKTGVSHEGVHRYCHEFMLKTGHGILRVKEGDWVLSHPCGFKTVLSDAHYKEAFNGDQ